MMSAFLQSEASLLESPLGTSSINSLAIKLTWSSTRV